MSVDGAISRVKGSIVDMQEEIEHDLEELDQVLESLHSPEDELEIVNLNQLCNSIETNTSNNEEGKHSITQVLNQTVKHQKAMNSIDQCIHIALKTWNIKQLKTKKAEDLYELLQQKQYKMTSGGDVVHFFYEAPSVIFSKILRIAKRISAMKLLLDHQQVVRLPNTPKEWSILLERLKQKGQSLAVTIRQITMRDLTDADNELAPNTELKEDTKSSDQMEAALSYLDAGSKKIDSSVKAVTANDALQDILLKHRKYFIKTVLYKQMMGGNKTHNRGSSIMSSIFKGVTKSLKSSEGIIGAAGAGKSNSYLGNVMVNITEDKQLQCDDSRSALTDIEIEPLKKDSDEEELENDPNQQHITQCSESNTIVFNSAENIQRLHKNWKHPKCDGCGDTIFIHFDGKHEETKRVITYDCQFVQDLDDTVSSLVYFHDIHCENLRKYKESIRRYVLESQLPKHVLNHSAHNMKNYVKHLLKHKDLLINIHSGKLPRPATLLEQKKAKFLGIFRKRSKKHNDDEINNNLQMSMDMHQDTKEQEFTLVETCKQREIAVRLLTKEQIFKDTFQRNKIKMFHHFIDDDAEEQNEDIQQSDNDEIAGIFDDIPRTIQYADSDIFGEPLFKFVVQQLLSKQTGALWKLLAYISMQLPTVDAISLLNEHQSDVAKAKKMEHLELVCTSVIQSSSYPIGTALHLSGFMSDLADNDLSREDDLRLVATRYIAIAEHLVEYVESDHLLALLLECPTDIKQMNVFDIAIEFGLDDFFDNNRVDRVMTHMHQQFDFLNPNKTFSTKELSTFQLLQYIYCSPSKFFYSPIGKWWTAAILYVVYVLVVTLVCFKQNYLYVEITAIEYIMWIANAGYITYEVTEMMLYGVEYFNETSNFFDSFISINWLFLGFLRLLGPVMFPTNWIYDDDDLIARNKICNVIYMFLFAMEMILLYLRFATILQRSRSLGPYVRMIISMVSDICNFSLIVLLLMTGFICAISFIIGPDKEPSSAACYDDDADHSKVPLSTLPSIALYVFQTLLGEQEWDATHSNQCLSENRSRIVQFYIMIFSVLGTVLLLNLLIAMMASTYENRRAATSKDVNASRTQETYVLAHRNALIAAPFNIVAYAVSIFFELLTILVIACSCGKYVFDIFSLVPVSVDYNSADAKVSADAVRRQSMSRRRKNCKRIAKCCCEFIRKVEDLAPNRDRKAYIRSVYFNYGDGGRCFCRYCKSYIADTETGESSGDISQYFNLFVHYRLDADDVQLMKRIMHNTGVCNKCYRPYKILGAGATDRLQRWEIQLEIISYYIFRIFVHIPMLAILLLPALFGGCASLITQMTKEANRVQSSYDSDIQLQVSSDEHYRHLVENVINNELQQDIDLLSTQIQALDNKFGAISQRQEINQNEMQKITNLLNSIYKELKTKNDDEVEDDKDKKKQLRELSFQMLPQAKKDLNNDKTFHE